MLSLEFLNRISIFSLLAWGFFFIAATGAILLTTLRTPLLRRYRKTLIAVSGSSLALGLAVWSMPLFFNRIAFDQSRLTPIDELTRTEWIEPLGNPETELPEEEIGWASALGYQFKYKLRPGFGLASVLASGPESLVLLDQEGNLRGFHAYTGLNHWVIRLRIHELVDSVLDGKKMYLLERTTFGAMRILCVDYLNPALLWARSIPRAKEGALMLDPETQTLTLSGADGGVWALKSKTGEVIWKRPELYSRVRLLRGGAHLLLFEPKIAGKSGHWVFLDPATGKTLHRTPHEEPDLMEFYGAGSPDGHRVQSVIALVDKRNLFFLNPRDLTRGWTHRLDSPVRALLMLEGGRWISLDESNLLELWDRETHVRRWQKRILPSTLSWIKTTPDQKRLVVPGEREGESRSLLFFDLDSGADLGAAHASEPLRDVHFLGDWVYLMSENHVWAFRKR